ncbi:unnamed protein product [Fusarium graminearum]|nr:unnamed protein product [Fusarium graminearum]
MASNTRDACLNRTVQVAEVMTCSQFIGRMFNLSSNEAKWEVILPFTDGENVGLDVSACLHDSDNDLSSLYMSRELLPVSRDNLTCALQVDLRGAPAIGRRSQPQFGPLFPALARAPLRSIREAHVRLSWDTGSNSQFIFGPVQLGDPASDDLRYAIHHTHDNQ